MITFESLDVGRSICTSGISLI